MNDQDKKRQALNWTILGLTVALASVLVPAVFPKEITVSPLVLFCIVYLSNVAACLIPEDRAHGARIFGRPFFARLLASLCAAMLLILIATVARGF
jgi:hypothetical protein